MIYRQSAWILVVLSLSICFGRGEGSSSGGGNPPPTPTYTVTGTISGLSGAVFLQNNATDLLGLNTNGNLSFSKSVLSGKPYEVTIWGQPLSPAQFCIVTNGKGTAVANVTNVQVTC